MSAAHDQPPRDGAPDLAARALAAWEAIRPELEGLSDAARAARIEGMHDAELRAEMMRLAGVFEARPLTPSRPRAAPSIEPGALLGERYRLVRKLGEGAASVVYLAEQEAPIKRQVAIKILPSELGSQRAALRFEAECNALSRMSHPYVASLLDAGRTRDGRPFVVMEYVEGQPLDVHARLRRSSARQRAELMVKVCRGVHHAHQKGIVHRDLKPGNVLVTTRDGQALPKIIDFGIAKLRDGGGPRTTLAGLFVGTPEYMSPEQAGVGDGDVDTISDVYALGVMFYELLTGRLPRGREGDDQDISEWQRLLASVDPVKPSQRLAAERARCEPSLRSELTAGVDPEDLAGDLDSIVMKALARQRERRYSSASELAADIERHLAGEPILARPPSLGYLLGRLVRRHAVLVASLGVLLGTALVATLIILDFAAQREDEARRADAARQRAEDQRELARAKEALAEELAARSHLASARVALEVQDAATVMRNLALIPPGQRGWEWRWVAHEVDRSSATGLGHVGAIRRVAPLAEDELVVTAGDDGALRVWLADRLVPVLALQAHARPVTGLAVGIGGRGPIAVSTDGAEVVAHDLASGGELWRSTRQARLSAEALSPDGERLVLVEGDARVLVVDAWTGAPLVTFGHDAARVLRAGFTAAGYYLDAGDFTTLYDAERRPYATLAGQAPTLSPERQVMSLAPWNKAGERRLFDVLEGGVSGVVESALPIQLIAVSAGGLATSERAGVVSMRDRADAPPRISLPGHRAGVTSMAFGPLGSALFSGDAAGALKRWDVDLAPTPFRVAASNDVVYAAALAPDAELLATVGWGTVKLWDTRTGRELATRWWTRAYSTAVAFSPDGEMLAAADWRGEVLLLEAHTLKEVARYRPFEGRVTALAWTDGAEPARSGERGRGPIVLGTALGELAAMDAASGQLVWRRVVHPDTPVIALAARRAVVASAGGVEQALPDFEDQAAQVAARDPFVRLTRVQDGAPARALDGVSGPFSSVAWSRDGRELAAGAEDGTVTVWSVDSGRVRLRRSGVGGRVAALAWSVSQRRLLVGHAPGVIVIADAANLEPLLTLPGAPPGLRALFAARDGGAVLAAGHQVPLVVYENESRAPAAARARWAKARAELDAALTREPEARARLAATGAGELAELARARGDNPNLLNSEAWARVRYEGEARGGVALARKKAEICAEGWPIWQFENTRALARLRDGDPEGALASVRRSVALQAAEGIETHPSDWATAAMAELELGRGAEARDHLERAERELQAPEWRGVTEVQALVLEARRRLSRAGGTPVQP